MVWAAKIKNKGCGYKAQIYLPLGFSPGGSTCRTRQAEDACLRLAVCFTCFSDPTHYSIQDAHARERTYVVLGFTNLCLRAQVSVIPVRIQIHSLHQVRYPLPILVLASLCAEGRELCHVCSRLRSETVIKFWVKYAAGTQLLPAHVLRRFGRILCIPGGRALHLRQRL